jgi:hypothetical protein
MIRLQDAWRQCKRWIAPEPDPSGAPSFSSGRAYMREWHRRQREAIRAAIEAQQKERAD